VALRPEKIAMLKDNGAKPAAPECPEGYNIAHGVIRGMSYLGDVTIYEVKLDTGRVVRVSRPNLSRYDQEDFTWHDVVWLTWHNSSPIVLLS
jgi:ABC-type Fe3+/spermidine/putrescine transport system ATPase subunit